jgi:hypothetical protein
VIGNFHIEPALVTAYAITLMIVATALEWFAKHSHKRADRYYTGGFHFHRDRDAWECPMGIALIRAEIDLERQTVLYRAPAHTCNNCQIKSRCTNSDSGREIAVPIDPWVRSASLGTFRFLAAATRNFARAVNPRMRHFVHRTVST